MLAVQRGAVGAVPRAGGSLEPIYNFIPQTYRSNPLVIFSHRRINVLVEPWQVDLHRPHDTRLLAGAVENVTVDELLQQEAIGKAQTLMLNGALDGTEDKTIKAKIQPEIQRLTFRKEEGKVGGKDEQELIEFGFDFLRNFSKRLASADLEENGAWWVGLSPAG